jgi:hypothetical protein
MKYSKEFLAGGASYESGLHITAAPENGLAGTLYHAAALLSDSTGRLFFRKYQILVSGWQRALNVAIEKDIDLKRMHFSAYTGLIDRLVVLDDPADNITLAYPLGVGGVDEASLGGDYHILTPRYQNAFIDRKNVNPARSEPAYFRHRPFMPITKEGANKPTAVAFHITILSDDEAETKGLDYLVRGFESHGCMRLRSKDLMEFFEIVEKGADDKVPVNVDYHVWNRNAQGVRDSQAGGADIDVAYPVNKYSFMKVTYFKDAPYTRRDEVEHLLEMDSEQGQPDFRRLEFLRQAADMLSGDGVEDLDPRYLAP